MKTIPNLNTISTVIERMCITNVKKSQFSYGLLDDPDNEDLRYKVKVQTDISKDIRSILLEALEDVFHSGKYEYYKENRSLV